MEQVAQRCCEVSINRDIKDSAGHGPGQPVLVDLLRAGLWTRQYPEVHSSFNHSMILCDSSTFSTLIAIGISVRRL